jgi:hypothetical protein
MILSAHQPNFFPWLPFFAKMKESDVFVLLGNVQYARHQFQNRFFYNGAWQTMSVNRGHLHDSISSKKYINFERDWIDIKNRVKNPKMELFEDLISVDLLSTNVSIISRASQLLKIETKLELDHFGSDYDANHRLVNLCKYYGADTYLAGPSGKRYLNEDLFQSNKIRIIYKTEDSIVKTHFLDVIK